MILHNRSHTKGAFNNYMDQILPNFDPPPSSSCPRSYWIPLTKYSSQLLKNVNESTFETYSIFKVVVVMRMSVCLLTEGPAEAPVQSWSRADQNSSLFHTCTGWYFILIIWCNLITVLHCLLVWFLNSWSLIGEAVWWNNTSKAMFFQVSCFMLWFSCRYWVAVTKRIKQKTNT